MSLIDYLTQTKHVGANLSADPKVRDVADWATVNFVPAVLAKNSHIPYLQEAFFKIHHAVMASKERKIYNCVYRGYVERDGVPTELRYECEFDRQKSKFIYLVLSENNGTKQYSLKLTYNASSETLIEERKMQFDYINGEQKLKSSVQQVYNTSIQPNGRFTNDMVRRVEYYRSDNPAEKDVKIVSCLYPTLDLLVASQTGEHINYFKLIPTDKEVQHEHGIALIDKNKYLYNIGGASAKTGEQVDLEHIKSDFGIALSGVKAYEIADKRVHELYDKKTGDVEINIMKAYGTPTYEGLDNKVSPNTFVYKVEDSVQ